MQTYAAWLLVVCMLHIYRVQTSQIPWWNIRIAQEQGPNVCVVEGVTGAKHHIWTECKYWNSRYICGVKPLLKYDCCGGFERVPDTSGCIGVTALENVLNTAKQLGGGRFVHYLQKFNLSQELQSDGPYTLFVPSDEAFEEPAPNEYLVLQARCQLFGGQVFGIYEVIAKALSKDRLTRFETNDANYVIPVLEYHIAEGRITSSQFNAEFTISTKNKGKKLRINKYSSRMETVNCALLQRKDQEASNGVVHIISEVLDPSTTIDSHLAELLVQDGRFHQLSQALDRSGLMDTLRSAEQSFTILAPSDEAFVKIRPSRLTLILENKPVLRELLGNHIIPHLICVPAIIGEHTVHTLGADNINFDCDQNGIKMNRSRLHADFTMGENGAIYVIDDVLVPNSAKSIIQILEEENKQFLQKIRFAGLEDTFENFGEYTMFVPTEAAMTSLPGTTIHSFRNQEKARQFVLFHITQGRIKTKNLNNKQELRSLSEGSPLRIQFYRSRVTPGVGSQLTLAVEDALVLKQDIDCMNGVIHVIDKALFPINHTVGELLRRMGNCKIFLKAMEQLSTENELMDNSRTFFVPSDNAFQTIDKNLYDKVMSNPAYMTKVLKNHMSDTLILFKVLQPELHYSFPSYLGTLTITRGDGNMKVNTANVLEHDIMTTNGVIHIINEVLLTNEIGF